MKKSHVRWILAIALLEGGYMLFDGINKLTTGRYFGGEVGPWARVASAVGIGVDSMAPVFVVVGALWLAGVLALLLNLRWARALVCALAVLTLGYPLFGTLLSIVVLVLLFRGDKLRAQ